MNTQIRNPEYRSWLKYHIAAVFCFLMFFAFHQLMPALAGPIYQGPVRFWYYSIMAPVTVALYLVFRRNSDVREVKLIFALCLWAFITRILTGNPTMSQDGYYILNLSLAAVFLPTFMLISGRRREQLMDLIALILGIFYAVLGLIGVYTALSGNVLSNPLSPYGSFCSRFHDGSFRYVFLDENPNICAIWFLLGFFLLLYLFFRYKKALPRLGLILLMLPNYFGIALTQSRNVMLGFAFGFGLFAALLLLERLKGKKLLIKLLCCLLLLCLLVPIFYLSFDVSAGLIDRFSAAPKGEILPSGEEAQAYSHRDFTHDTGRIPIYKSGLYTLRDDPIRLLIGSSGEGLMEIANTYLSKPYSHYHNYLLNVLVLLGIPGLLLALTFSVLVIIHAVRLFFSEDERASMPVKLMILPLSGLFIYNMLEVSLFFYMDVRSLMMLLLCGWVLAYSYEICPLKKRKK